MDSLYLLLALLLACGATAYVIDTDSPSDAVVDADDGPSGKLKDSKRTDLYDAAGLAGGASSDHGMLAPPGGKAERGGPDDDRDALDVFRMSPHAAKAVLRDRRWSYKDLTGEREEEKEDDRARQRAERAREAAAHLNRICPGQCWSSYGALGACSAECGNSGVQWQHRQIQPSSQCASWVNSNGCPGNPSRSQACNRFCHNGGTALATSCSCPAGYQGNCCGTRVTCGNPGSVANGNVVPGGTIHFYGVTVTFSCELGYNLVGPATRVCQNNGQWTNSVPSCILIDCGDPGTPDDGAISGSVFTYGASVTFNCSTGYRLYGSSIRQCDENGQWSGTQPTCAEITCPTPAPLDHGVVDTPGGVTYGMSAIYSCDEHYYLSGVDTRTCQLDGTWSGSAPVCNAILCAMVEAPEFGSVSFTSVSGSQSVMHGGQASFSCDEGYILTGATTRTCTGTGPRGVWSGSQPTCQPVSCGDPGTVQNGVRSQTGFEFPSGRVSYQCVAGYYMSGAPELRCQSSGLWTDNTPTCTACPEDYYKPATDQGTTCESCPVNTHTAGVASTSRRQCACDLGYEGDSGGPCTLISCENLDAPEHGFKDSCSNTYNQVCQFDCDAGYIQTGGNAARTCQLNSQWSGSALVCTACAKDTYKLDTTTCTFCPEDSHTAGEASVLAACTCDDGFDGPNGGPCQDVNECDTDNGGCDQTCENEIGDFQCTCTLPGYIKDSQDSTKCVSKNQCPELKPIANGGFVCVAAAATSTQRCQPKCNRGYEHFVRPNSYEECGPSTNWVWTSELREVPLFPCQKAFFEGITLEVDMFYFTDDCESLSEGQIASVKAEFLQFLKEEKGVCRSAQMPCEISDCEVECGDTEDKRRRRSAEDESGLRVKFNVRVNAVEQETVDCNAVCDREGASERYCNNNCMTNYFSNITSVISTQMDEALSSGDESIIHVGQVTLVPQAAPVVVAQPPSCDEGMVKVADSCAPCLAGSYKSSNTSECDICPPQTYQPDAGQTDCLPCRWIYEWGAEYCKDPLQIIIDITREAFNLTQAANPAAP